ncbi:hypothetical protein PYW07_003422 [Mythimna separata]|uniref:CRIB domain-containing protein n=1 Tax=Mythimna separata TaxID=271217 RepID=A0AAD7YJ57_MYTSE|nr:hypothetical protein PYW07_003422 [Mythimna separata]
MKPVVLPLCSSPFMDRKLKIGSGGRRTAPFDKKTNLGTVIQSYSLDIGTPTDMRRNIHVTKNPETGHLEGLPKSWAKFWNKLSMNKQNEDPGGIATTTQFYTTDNDKPPEGPSSTSLEMKEIEEGEEELL